MAPIDTKLDYALEKVKALRYRMNHLWDLPTDLPISDDENGQLTALLAALKQIEDQDGTNSSPWLQQSLDSFVTAWRAGHVLDLQQRGSSHAIVQQMLMECIMMLLDLRAMQNALINLK